MSGLDLKSLQINLRHTHESIGLSKSVAMKLIQELEETRARHRKAWGRAEKAEAAVARVRELALESQAEVAQMNMPNIRTLSGEILRALDGEPNE